MTHYTRRLFIFSFAALFLFVSRAKAQHVELLQQGKPTSIRGLSVVNDSIAWISGSKGYIAFTNNGGKTWAWQQVKGYEQADFRAIQAFSGKEAIIMSSGTPALVLKTTNGGQNWQLMYKNTDTAYFLDAMDFADEQHGYILGDPINNKFLLLETQDGGETWRPFKDQPAAFPNEAAFAASGTCLRVDESDINIVTGGSQSRLLIFPMHNTTHDWLSGPTGIKHGKASQGAFSLAENGSIQIFVGGDYAKDKLTDSVASVIVYCCYANAIQYPKTGPAGYQSCVEYIFGSTFLSTGTPGTNITIDGGKIWSKIDSASYNVCRKARQGTLVLLAGADGKIGILKP